MEDDFYFSADGMSEWFNVALGIGGSLVSLNDDLNPVYGAALGLVGSVVEASGGDEDAEPEKVNLAEVQSKLGDMFNTSVVGLVKTARLAVGRPWYDESYDDLPLLGDSKHEEQIANFYNHPF